MGDLAAALAAFRARLGAAHVLDDPATCTLAATTNFATTRVVPAVIRPGDRDEVRDCLRLAAAHGVPLYPVSRGKNWGYGSRVPVGSGQVVMELGRLDRIVELNRRFAYVVVEPGVTQGQLDRHLRRHAPELLSTATGAPGDASVIGNLVERGIGLGPLGDRFAGSCELEVVLPGGELIHTGWERFAGARAAHLSPTAVGPHLAGLFTQSSLGVVTRATIWLRKRPAAFALVAFGLDALPRLAGATDGIRELALAGALPSTVALWNDYRRFALGARYPFAEARGRTPLPPRLRRALQARLGATPWSGMVGLGAASAPLLAAHLDLFRRAVEPHCVQYDVFLEPPDGGDWRDTPFFGAPHDANLASLYWRKGSDPPADADPDRDRCGLLWLDALVPLDGRLLARALRECARRIERHRFEPSLIAVVPWPRAAYVLPMIVFDREVPGEDQRAAACRDELRGWLVAEGLLLTRLGIDDMGAQPPATDDSDALLRRLKQLLDPAAILAPGRYEPP